MRVVLLNDTRADINPGCQATVSTLVRQLAVALDAQVTTRPRGEGYACFAQLAGTPAAHDANAWSQAVNALGRDDALSDALAAADLVVANLEGTFHHHSVGALALGGALALAHRAGRPVWAVNGSVDAIDPWLLAATLMPAAHVAVREPRSAQWLRRRGVPAMAAADAAFLAETFLARPDHAGGTTDACYTPGVLATTAVSLDRAVADVLADLDALTDAGWTPCFVQFDDRETALADALRERGRPVRDGRTWAWQDLGGWLRTFGLVVSGRYHVLIFAAMAGVPAIALPSNTHKIEGLLELLGRTDAFAPDLPALRARLAAGPPTAVDVATIRVCQQLARRAVVLAPDTGAGAVASAPLVAGLDWARPSALRSVLLDLRSSGPASFDAVLATTPLDTGLATPSRVRDRAGWQEQFEATGFDITGERTVPREHAPAGTAVTPALHPLGMSTDGARRVLTVRRAPQVTRPVRPSGPSWCHDSNAHVRFLVSDAASFERLAPFWRSLADAGCSMVVRSDVADTTWTAAQHEIRAWCHSLEIPVCTAASPRDVDWQLPGRPGLLVASGPTPGQARTFPAGFLVAARRRGWDTRVFPAMSPGPADAPVPAFRGGSPDAPLRLALFGASSCGRTLARQARAMPEIALIGVIDNDRSRWGDSLDGAPVVAPDAAAFDAADVIVVASLYAEAIAAQVTSAGHGHKLVFDLACLGLQDAAAATTAHR